MSDVLEPIEKEALTDVIAYAKANETSFLADIDALVKTGEHTASSAIVTVFKQKVPLIGGAIGGDFAKELDSLEPQAENAIKVGFDKAIAFLESVLAKLP